MLRIHHVKTIFAAAFLADFGQGGGGGGGCSAEINIFHIKQMVDIQAKLKHKT